MTKRKSQMAARKNGPARPRPRKRQGPNITLTSAIIGKVCKSAASLPYRQDAAWAVGVPERTFYRWLRRGRLAYEAWDRALALYEDAVEGGAEPPAWPPEETKGDRLCRDLWMRLKTEEAKAKLECSDDVRRGGQGWQGPMTLLERRFPDQYAKRERLETTSVIGTVDIDPDDAVKHLAGILARHVARGEEDASPQ